MTYYTAPQTAGYTCAGCGMSVPANVAHACLANERTRDVQLLATLDQILESLRLLHDSVRLLLDLERATFNARHPAL